MRSTATDAPGGPAGAADAPAPTMAFAGELQFALDLADRAGVVLMEHYEQLEQIDYKSARDVVTEADHLSEALIPTPSSTPTPSGSPSGP